MSHHNTPRVIGEIAPTPVESSWFAVQIRPRFEKKVALELDSKGIKSFLPLFPAAHQWSDRQQVVHLPMFPGYVFVRIHPRLGDRIPVLRTNGVISFVGTTGMGSPVPDAEIDAIQKVIDRNVPFLSHAYLNVGQRVCIRGGSLDGITGILTAINGDQSLVVSVELIQRSIAMKITGYRVEAA
jgi:transcription antitermination factor NusG